MTTRVWIAQCLCGPNRHAILAVARECDDEADPRQLLPVLRKEVANLRRFALNPWCAICGSLEENWRYEVGRTHWRTMKEAEPELAKAAAGNSGANLAYGTHGPDRPGSA